MSCQVRTPAALGRPMIIGTEVDKRRVAELGKDYKWVKPDSCSRCSQRPVHGHGYVTAIFEGFSAPIFLKRYRCVSCGCVMTMRPKDHIRRFQTSLASIYEALSFRFKQFKWPCKGLRQRAGHWLRRFLTFIRIEYGETDSLDISARIEILKRSCVDFLSCTN